MVLTILTCLIIFLIIFLIGAGVKRKIKSHQIARTNFIMRFRFDPEIPKQNKKSKAQIKIVDDRMKMKALAVHTARGREEIYEEALQSFDFEQSLAAQFGFPVKELNEYLQEEGAESL